LVAHSGGFFFGFAEQKQKKEHWMRSNFPKKIAVVGILQFRPNLF